MQPTSILALSSAFHLMAAVVLSSGNVLRGVGRKDLGQIEPVPKPGRKGTMFRRELSCSMSLLAIANGPAMGRWWAV